MRVLRQLRIPPDLPRLEARMNPYRSELDVVADTVTCPSCRGICGYTEVWYERGCRVETVYTCALCVSIGYITRTVAREFWKHSGASA